MSTASQIVAKDGRQLKDEPDSSVIGRGLFIGVALLGVLELIGCIGLWPSATEDTTGLGNSEIATILKRSCCVADQMVVKNIKAALEKAKDGQSLRSAAESVGFTCEASPSKTCRYAGTMTYQIHGAPKENIDSQKVHIVSYSILLPSYDNTNDVRADQKTTILP